MDSIHDIQTMITCTGLDEFVNHQVFNQPGFPCSDGTVAAETRNLENEAIGGYRN